MSDNQGEFEKQGSFYLGRFVETDEHRATPEEGPNFLYDAKDLTTHAVCVGMTGSGKTGLCMTLLEEAGVDEVPAICIDPKGDLGNLLLTFPELQPSDFEPWVDAADAARKNQSVPERAASVAELWRGGLAKWGISPERIARLRESVDLAIYTPGSSAGRQLAIVSSLAAPEAHAALAGDERRERITSTVSGVLGLLGIDADPVQSREHVFLSTLLQHAWDAGTDLSIGDLVRAVMDPPIQQVGVLPLDTFFPARDRQSLAMKLNALIASPGFAGWLEGEPLDVQRLLYTPEGRPRIVVLSIAHLSEAERMFFVTLLLNEVVSWMREQAGTSHLRALLYMDEVFGFLPPVAEPPSKRPLLTLLKQARAYGLGVVLATQNPVDLDYKALSNCGTWFLGRLQTERDVDRVIDGLQGAAQNAGQSFAASEARALLAGLSSRVFLAQNAHESHPRLFHTRWAMSYLRGPLTRAQIGALTPKPEPPSEVESASAPAAASASARASATTDSSATTDASTPASTTAADASPAVERATVPDAPPAGLRPAAATTVDPTPPASAPTVVSAPAVVAPPVSNANQLSSPGIRPAVPEHIAEVFVGSPRGSFIYRPAFLAVVDLHHVLVRADVDYWRRMTLLAMLDEDLMPDELWEEARIFHHEVPMESDPVHAQARFAELPGLQLGKGKLRSHKAALKNHLYQHHPIQVSHAPELKLYARSDESYQQFVERVRRVAGAQDDAELRKLQDKFERKITTARNKVERAEEKLRREKQQVTQAGIDTATTIATGVSALFGRGSVTSRAASAARKASRAAKEREDVQVAEAKLLELEQELADLELEAEEALDAARAEAGQPKLENLPIRPRKGDIQLATFALAWVPFGL